MAHALKEDKKEEEKKKIEEKPPALKRKEIVGYAIDSEKVEIKRLEMEDLEDVILILRKAQFQIGEKEKKTIEDILKEGISYGAYVDRMLVAVALAWKVGFDGESLIEGSNAVYIEEIALLTAYEGKGIREKLIEAIEKESEEYIVGYAGESVEDIDRYLESPNRLAKAYAKLGYKFRNMGEMLVAVKRVG